MPIGLPLDLDVLLAPLPGDAPSGSSSVFFEIRPRLEELRREVTPDTRQFEEQDLKAPDWAGVEKLTRDSLGSAAKDLRVVGYLIESLVKRYRFDGLRAGLELIRRLFADCWDFLLPAIEDGDLTARALPVENMLDAPDKGLRLPTSVRSIPVVRSAEGAFSYLDWRRSQDPKEKTQAALADGFGKALAATKPEAVTADSAAVATCLEELGNLTKVLDERIGSEAPALQRLREALEDSRRFVTFVHSKVVPGSPVGEENTDTPSDGTGTTGSAAARAGGASRESLYQQLDRLAVELERLEPHSPIPYLIRRAVRLGSMPFPALIRALIRDANVLGEITREFSLPEETT
jgi:type VI secretion system protein ImpA